VPSWSNDSGDLQQPTPLLNTASKTPLLNTALKTPLLNTASKTPLLNTASKTFVSNSAHVRARNATITGACVVSLPGGVKHAVAGAPCSLLLRTNPPCDSRLDWEVNLVSFAGDSMQRTSRNFDLSAGVPVVFAIGRSASGVYNCSFVTAQAGTVLCRARVRGRAMQPTSISIKVAASEPSASASSIYLVHPLPCVDVVTAGENASLRLMVRALG
jgi:hypothetical protein